MYEMKEVRRQLKNYHKEVDVKIDGLEIVDGELQIKEEDDDFFSIEKEITLNTDETLLNMQSMDHIAYMEKLLSDIEEVATDKEYNVCVFRSMGYTHQRIGNILGVSRERIRQIETKAIEKLIEAHRN